MPTNFETITDEYIEALREIKATHGNHAISQ